MSSEAIILNNFLISLEQDSHIFDGRFTVEEYINLKIALASAINALGEQRPIGEWIFKNGKYRCTACGEKAIYVYPGMSNIPKAILTDYCPKCGVQMNPKALEMIRKREGEAE